MSWSHPPSPGLVFSENLGSKTDLVVLGLCPGEPWKTALDVSFLFSSLKSVPWADTGQASQAFGGEKMKVRFVKRYWRFMTQRKYNIANVWPFLRSANTEERRTPQCTTKRPNRLALPSWHSS